MPLVATASSAGTNILHSPKPVTDGPFWQITWISFLKVYALWTPTQGPWPGRFCFADDLTANPTRIINQAFLFVVDTGRGCVYAKDNQFWSWRVITPPIGVLPALLPRCGDNELTT